MKTIYKEPCYSTIRDYKEGEKVWTNEGFLPLPNEIYLTSELDNDKEDFQIEILFENRWLKVQNIDFE